MIPRVIRIWPFTTLGVLTILLWMLLGWLHAGVAPGVVIDALTTLLRFVILPAYLMRYIAVAIGLHLFDAGAYPMWFQLATIPVMLAPYLLLDLMFDRATDESARARRAAAAAAHRRRS